MTNGVAAPLVDSVLLTTLSFVIVLLYGVVIAIALWCSILPRACKNWSDSYRTQFIIWLLGKATFLDTYTPKPVSEHNTSKLFRNRTLVYVYDYIAICSFFVLLLVVNLLVWLYCQMSSADSCEWHTTDNIQVTNTSYEIIFYTICAKLNGLVSLRDGIPRHFWIAVNMWNICYDAIQQRVERIEIT